MTKPSRLYVPVYTNLPDHPKTRRLARLMEMEPAHAMGHLVHLWLWSQEYATDGDLTPFAPEEIGWASGFSGDPTLWLRALEKSGFVADGQLHDWDSYAGKVRQQRERNAEKQAKWREKQLSSNSDNGYVTVTLPENNGLDKEKEEDKERDKSLLGSDDPDREHRPYTEEFEAFWSLYPRGRGDKLTAFKIWQRLSQKHRADAVAALPGWVACEQWRDGYFPACSKWLRGRAWEDLPPADRRPSTSSTTNRFQPKRLSQEDIASGRFTDQF